MADLTSGAGSFRAAQVALSTTSAVVVAANLTRRSVVIKNLDAAITIYVGFGTVTAANGMPLKAGESVAIDSGAAISAIAASGTPTIAYLESYDQPA